MSSQFNPNTDKSPIGIYIANLVYYIDSAVDEGGQKWAMLDLVFSITDVEGAKQQVDAFEHSAELKKALSQLDLLKLKPNFVQYLN